MEIHASFILIEGNADHNKLFRWDSDSFFHIFQSIDPHDNDWYSHSKQCIHQHSQLLITRTL